VWLLVVQTIPKWTACPSFLFELFKRSFYIKAKYISIGITPIFIHCRQRLILTHQQLL
jgi:hypothetical protein